MDFMVNADRSELMNNSQLLLQSEINAVGDARNSEDDNSSLIGQLQVQSKDCRYLSCARPPGPKRWSTASIVVRRLRGDGVRLAIIKNRNPGYEEQSLTVYTLSTQN